MTPEQREQWRLAKEKLSELIYLSEPERSARLASMNIDAGARSRLERLLAADRSPHPAVKPDPDWVIQAVDRRHLLSGRTVGAWVLDEPIGEGGMAIVYRCHRDTEDYQQVGALKLLRIGSLTPEGRRRFEREKRILAELRHPHIASLLDAGTADDGTPFIVLEYVDGRPIDKYVAGARPAERELVALFLKVCRAAAFAQRNLIVHRDIKPSNIIVDAEGEPRLLDFGIARLMEPDDVTGTTTRAFTPGYAAPEQLSGRPVTLATDVFGLGASLYRLLTGQPAFGRVAPSDPWPTPPFPSRLDPDLKNILVMALQEDAQRRYRDAAAMAEDLESWLRGRPVRATGDSLGYKVRKYIARHRFGVAASTLLVLTGAAGLTATLWQSRVARQQADLAVEQSTRAEAVRDFLIQLFEATAAGQIQDELPMTAKILERGARQAAEEFGDRPRLHAEMLLVVGRIYTTLGRYAEAELLLIQALTLLQSRADADPSALGATLVALAGAQRGSGREEQAIPLARRALRMLTPDDSSQLELRTLAADELTGSLIGMRHAPDADTAKMNSIDQDRIHEATGVAMKVFQEVREFAPANARLLARSAHTLGWVKARTGDLAAATTLFRQANAAAMQLPGSLELKLSNATSLAILLGMQGQSRLELDMLKDVLALTRQGYPEGHPTIGRALITLSFALSDLGYLRQAAAASREARSIMLATFGPDHLSAALANYNLGKVLAGQGRHEEALETYEESERIVAQAMPENDWRRCSLLINQADSLIELGRFQEAGQALDLAYAIARAIDSERQIASATSMRAKLHLEAGDAEQAETDARAAVEWGRRLYPDGSGFAAQNLGRLMLLAFSAGNLDDAADYFDQAEQELGRIDGYLDRAATAYIGYRTQYLLARGDRDGAAQHLQGDIDALTQQSGPRHPRVAQLQRLLAELETAPSHSGDDASE